MAQSARPISINEHPLVRRLYYIPTRNLDELGAQFMRWLDERVPRLSIFAPPGYGKTMAISHMQTQVDRAFSGNACFRINAMASAAPSKLFGAIREASDCPTSRGSLYVQCQDLADHIKGLTVRSGQPWAILWVDDAHLLDGEQDDWLRTLQLVLSEVGVLLMTVLVGQPELLALNRKRSGESILATHVLPLVRSEQFELGAPNSADDIAELMAAYDSICYPDSSSWTYSRFFVTEAYDNGFRLRDQAVSFWQACLELSAESGAKQPPKVPISCLTKAVESALMGAQLHGDSERNFTTSMWKSCLQPAGFYWGRGWSEIGAEH